MIPINGFEGYSIKEDGQVLSARKGRFLTPHLNENGYLYVTLRRANKNSTRAVHRLVAEAYISNPDNKPFVNHLDADRTNAHKDNLEWCTQSENIKHAYVLGNMSQKKNFTIEELEWLFTQVINQSSNMTALAKKMNVGLSRLTINLRNHAHRTERVVEFETALSSQKRVRNTAANASKQKPVTQYDLQGNFIAEFPSATAAARALNKVSSGSIANALNPAFPQQIAFGYIWKYA